MDRGNAKSFTESDHSVIINAKCSDQFRGPVALASPQTVSGLSLLGVLHTYHTLVKVVWPEALSHSRFRLETFPDLSRKFTYSQIEIHMCMVILNNVN
jgi:hypothetical protein